MDPNAPGGAEPQPSSPTPPANPPAPTEAPPPVPPSNEAPKEKTPEEILSEVNLTGMSDEQVADLESGDPARIAKAIGAPPPTEKKPEAQEPPASQQPAGDQGPERISLKAIKDPKTRIALVSAISEFREGKFTSVEDAIASKLGIKTAPAEAPPASQAPAGEKKGGEAPPAAPVSDAVKAAEAKLADLQAKKEQAKAEYDYDKAESLNDEILEARLELRDAKRDAESHQATVAQFQAAEDASRARVMSIYGEHMTDPESAFNEEVDVQIMLAERKNDPILTKPDWPEKIAERVAKRLNITPAGDGKAAPAGTKGAPPPEDEIIPPPPPRSIRIPGSPVAGGANTAALTPTQAMAELDKLNPQEREKVLELLERKKV